MKIIGYWQENIFDEQYLNPVEVQGLLEPDICSKVSDHLASGEILNTYRGCSWCRLFCGIDSSELGCSELTDGTWIWPKGLIHYVVKHQVLLPSEFILHVMGGPKLSSFNKNDPVDITFWIDWCKTHRDRKYLEYMLKVRTEKKRLIDQEMKKLIQEKKVIHGVSHQTCMWRGCDEKALSDIVFCAMHSITDVEKDLIQMKHSALPLIKINTELDDSCNQLFAPLQADT